MSGFSPHAVGPNLLSTIRGCRTQCSLRESSIYWRTWLRAGTLERALTVATVMARQRTRDLLEENPA